MCLAEVVVGAILTAGLAEHHHGWVHEGVFERMTDEVNIETGRPYTEPIANGDVMILHIREDSPRHAIPRAPTALPAIPRNDEERPFVAAAVAILANTSAPAP